MEKRKRDLKKITEEVKRDMQEAGIPFNDEIPFSLNGRLKSSLGRCLYDYNYFNGKKIPIKIEIQKDYFLNAKIEDIKNTLCHELIHSADECVYSGHGGKWLEYANKMTKKTSYKIEKCSCLDYNYKTGYKYEAYCPKCGASWPRKSNAKIIQSPHNYKCGNCYTPLESRCLK